MDQKESHEMVGELLDLVNGARDEGRAVSLIVMLGGGWQGLMDDVSAKQFLTAPNIGEPWKFCGIPIASSGAQPGRSYRVEYA